MESSSLTAPDFVILILAVYRIAVLIAIEEGPFGIMESLRSHIDPLQTTWLGRGARCVGCISFWLAGLVAFIFHAMWWEWLGMAGGVLVIHKAVNR